MFSFLRVAVIMVSLHNNRNPKTPALLGFLFVTLGFPHVSKLLMKYKIYYLRQFYFILIFTFFKMYGYMCTYGHKCMHTYGSSEDNYGNGCLHHMGPGVGFWLSGLATITFTCRAILLAYYYFFSIIFSSLVHLFLL